MKTFLLFILLFFSTGFNAQMLVSVYFEHDSYKLSKESEKKLDSLAQLKANLRIRIFGNCDISGNNEYNKTLSENRANIVSQYLQSRIGKNIKLESSIGLGEEKQINDNSTEELRGKNRRVDVFIDKIFSKDEIKSGKTFVSFFNMRVSQMKVKDTFSLPHVNFIGGRHIWLPEGTKTLLQFAGILHDNPGMEIELQGHICCDYDNFDGEDLDLKTFNLSWTRANAIKEFLEQQGIKPSRIKVTGQGHLNPVVYPERTENDFMKNRRVEIVLLKK